MHGIIQDGLFELPVNLHLYIFMNQNVDERPAPGVPFEQIPAAEREFQRVNF